MEHHTKIKKIIIFSKKQKYIGTKKHDYKIYYKYIVSKIRKYLDIHIHVYQIVLYTYIHMFVWIDKFKPKDNT